MYTYIVNATYKSYNPQITGFNTKGCNNDHKADITTAYISSLTRLVFLILYLHDNRL
jgi:hypothetical protein